MIDPIPAVGANGVVYSNCDLRRETNHQSTANIASAITLIVAHKPTYLKGKVEKIENEQNLNENCRINVSFKSNILVSKCFNIVDKTTSSFFTTTRFPQKAR